MPVTPAIKAVSERSGVNTMLEGLDSIPWSQLKHAYGSAADVPALIRAVASADVEEREEAWDALCGNLWHQGSIYEATAHAAPFFVELALHPEVPDREAVLAYLVNLAEGTSARDVHQHLEIFAQQRITPEWQRQRIAELGFVAATREAIAQGREGYKRLLEQGSPTGRTIVAHLLSLFPEHAAEYVRWLQEHVDAGESDERTRAWCVLSVARLAGYVEVAPWLQVLFASDPSEAVRVVAVLGLVWGGVRPLPAGARELLGRHARRTRDVGRLFEGMPWDAGDELLQNDCIDALEQLRDPFDHSLDALLFAMDEAAPFQAIEIMRNLLARYLPEGGPVPPLEQIDAEQRRVLFAIAQSEQLWADWQGRVRIMRATEVLERFGLPTPVQRLRSFLEGEPASQEPP